MLLEFRTRWNYRSLASGSIALGYARTRQGVGGVRNHLNAIKDYSSKNIVLFPDERLCAWADKKSRWRELDNILFDFPLDRYSVVHSHVNPGFISACMTAQKKGTPWVHTYHTLYFPAQWGGTLASWQEEINRALIEDASKADVRISISPWLQEFLETKYGITSSVIPNGVNVEMCEAVDLENYGYIQPDQYVLFSGNLKSVKNPEMFIELAKRVPDLMFVMIGQDLIADNVEKYYKAHLPKNLLLLGPVPHTIALAYTKAASAVVVTSHSEGLPTVVMEAMAMGRPVVVPDAYGCRDLVIHEKTGFVFEPGNIDDLYQCLMQSLSNRDVGQAAATEIRSKYAWPVVIENIDNIYESLMTNKCVSE